MRCQFFMQELSRSSLSGALCVLVFVLGCFGDDPVDPNRASVAGQVFFQEKPLPGGSISFVSESDPKYRITGMIQSDGSFAFDDAPVGMTRVIVETESLRYGNPQQYVVIPQKYGQLQQTDLAHDIQPGKNEGLRLELR